MSKYAVAHITPFGGETFRGRHEEKIPFAITCPYCSSFGTFQNAFQSKLVFENFVTHFPDHSASRSSDSHTFVSAHMCPNPKCRGVVLVCSFNGFLIEYSPKSDFAIHIAHVPDEIYYTFKEALRCYNSGCYRATALMVRRVLEEVCEESGAGGRTLHDRMSVLRGKVILPPELFEVIHELKALGNDAAHVDARNYEKIGEEEARISLELVAEILKARYEVQSLVDRIRSRKSEEG